MAHFRIRLKQLVLEESARRGAPISQRQLAAETHLDLTTISRWYRDDVKRMEPETLHKLLKYFHCTFEDLVELVDDESH